MFRIIKFLFTGDWHLHQWETVETKNMTKSGKYTNGSTYERDVTVYILRCKHCGEIKSVEV